MTETQFCDIVVEAFPELRADIEEWHDLIHLQKSEFLALTQRAIETRSFDVVKRCFEIATAALLTGDDHLKNAIYVSYLEGINLRSDAGREAAAMMPPELRQGRYDILDHDEKLLGRKWSTDDR